MAAGYSREFLVKAFVSRYEDHMVPSKFRQFTQKFGYDFYDKVGKEEFRKWTSLDAEAIRNYKASLE